MIVRKLKKTQYEKLLEHLKTKLPENPLSANHEVVLEVNKIKYQLRIQLEAPNTVYLLQMIQCSGENRLVMDVIVLAGFLEVFIFNIFTDKL